MVLRKVLHYQSTMKQNHWAELLPRFFANSFHPVTLYQMIWDSFKGRKGKGSGNSSKVQSFYYFD